jgi:hypothetical protein
MGLILHKLNTTREAWPHGLPNNVGPMPVTLHLTNEKPVRSLVELLFCAVIVPAPFESTVQSYYNVFPIRHEQ